MKIQRSTEMLHPILKQSIEKIQSNIIDIHNMPIRLFETGRNHDRQEILINKGKTKDLVSKHLYNLDNVPPLYASAVDYVYYDGRWSWNLRDATIFSWYTIFGNLVMDMFPELNWKGLNRKYANYCHFQLRQEIIVNNLDKYPCVTY